MVSLAMCQREFVRGIAENIAKKDSATCTADERVLDASKLRLALQRCGSIEAVIREVQLKEQSSRFNEERCKACFSEYEEFDKLLEIARSGASVPLPDGFQLNQIQPSRRQLDMRLGNAYLKHAIKYSQSGEMVLFRLEDIPAIEQEKLHWTSPHCGPKPDAAYPHGFNPGGRFFFDVTNIENGWSVNSPEAALECTKQYGQLNHPTFEGIILRTAGASIHQRQRTAGNSMANSITRLLREL